MSRTHNLYTSRKELCGRESRGFCPKTAGAMAVGEAEEGQGMRHYQCRICGITRSKRSIIDQHMQHFHPGALSDFCVVGKDRRRYECTICGDSRSKLSLLRKHINASHSSPSQSIDVNEGARPTSECRKRKRHECKDCGRQVKKASYLEQHLLTHSSQLHVLHQNSTEKGDLSGSPGCTWLMWAINARSDRPFVCSLDGCGKCYRRRDHLKRHLIQHEENAHLCPRRGCIMLCSNRYNLQRHLRNHNLKGDLQRGVLETKKVLRCPAPDCSVTVKYPCRLQSHYDIAHGYHYADILCGELGCGEKFSSKNLLLQHIRQLHRSISCHMCGVCVSRKSFKRHLMGHESSSHVKQRLFCPFDGCVRSFVSSFNLSVHIRVGHMGRREYCCTFDGCNRTFGYKHTRDNHEKTHLHCHFQGNFEEEDLKFQARSRGGRKPLTLQKVEDLFRKRVVGPKEEREVLEQDG